MATCFLFIQQSAQETYLSLRLDDLGQLDAPLERRTLGAVHLLQAHARTIVVIPTQLSVLHYVELPWLDPRKARAAIPYALEEQVAQSVDSLHIAFDQQHYEQNKYLVAVINKAFLSDLMAHLDELNIGFDSITLDWFALNMNEACVSDTSLLIYDSAFQGALSDEPAAMYLADENRLPSIVAFNDSAKRLKHDLACMDGSFYEWVAVRLLMMKPMNLCQGELQHTKRFNSNTRLYQISAILGVLWLLMFIGFNSIVSYRLTHKITDVDQQIALIYRDFFPSAKQVISPRFRVAQLLNASRSGQDMVLWTLLDTLAHATHQKGFTIKQWRYENNMLSVTLISQDFAALEALQHRLQAAHVKVEQAQAASYKNHVLATLELRL